MHVADDGHRVFDMFSQDYDPDVACVLVGAATNFEAKSGCRMGGLSSAQQSPGGLTLRYNPQGIQ
jgi:hypothetical protein